MLPGPFISRKPLINSKGNYKSTIEDFVKKKKRFLFKFGSLFWDENYPNTSRCNILVDFPNEDSHSCSKTQQHKMVSQFLIFL